MFVGRAFQRFYADPGLARDLREDWAPWLLDGLGPDGDPPVDIGTDAVELVAGPATRLGRAAREVDLTRHDPDRLPLPSGSASALIALLVLHHLPDPAAQDRALAEWRRVLRPGGTLVALCPLDGEHFHRLDEERRCTPIDPFGLAGRATEAGFLRPVTRVWSLVGLTAPVPSSGTP